MGNPLAVLIVEDSDSDAQFMVRLLKKAGYEVAFQVVETAAHMRAALEQAAWDIVISDYSLPQFDGPAALRLLQETGLDLPFIAVSGAMGEAAAVAMMKAGAHDYLMKGNLARLAPAVEREIAQAEVRRKRRQAEEALRESEEFLSNLLEHAPVSIYVTAADGRMRLVNRHWESDTAKQRSDILGRPLDQIFSPETARQFAAENQKVIEAGVSLAFEEVAEAPVEPHHFFTVRFPLCNALGQVEAVGGISVDITERKRAEEALRDSEEKFRSIVEYATDGIALTDERGLVVEWNPTQAQLGWKARAEVIGQPLWDVQFQRARPERRTPEVYEKMKALFRDMLASGEIPEHVREQEATIQGPNGVERVIRSAIFSIKTTRGFRLAGISRDITEHKRAEEEIRKLNAELEQRVIERTAELLRQRERERAILDAMGEGVVFTDLAGTIEYINPAMERLTGFTAQEALGQNASIWQGGQTPSAIYQQMWAAISRGEMWQGELVNRHQDGRLYEIALTAAPLTTPDRQIVGFVGVQRDITRQKELDRLKDKFVANVSHELRTPLTSILLNLDLLDYGKPEKRPHYMATLHREAERLRQMIEDLLDISRLDRETAPVELASIDLHQLLGPLVADQATVAAERGLTLEFLPTAESPLALAEAGMLTQVVSNLITNALNYTPAGGSVTVQTHRQRAAAQDWITLTVRDTGPGIAAHELPHVFERFYRGEVGRQASAPGTGLGLAISKEIMEKLGGRITVESQPATEGRGTAFTVWLRPQP